MIKLIKGFFKAIKDDLAKDIETVIKLKDGEINVAKRLKDVKEEICNGRFWVDNSLIFFVIIFINIKISIIFFSFS